MSAGPTLTVHRWVDPMVETHPRAMPARSDAAEFYWLPLIGPTSLLCARRLVSWLEQDAPIVVGLDVLAQMLGVTNAGKHSVLPRTLNRLCGFGLARWRVLDAELDVRTVWAPLTERQVARLPELLVAMYRRLDVHAAASA